MFDSRAWGTSFSAHEYRQTVTHVFGLNCYLCVRTVPQPCSGAGALAATVRARQVQGRGVSQAGELALGEVISSVLRMHARF